jgi:hypothetical protein
LHRRRRLRGISGRCCSACVCDASAERSPRQVELAAPRCGLCNTARCGAPVVQRPQGGAAAARRCVGARRALAPLRTVTRSELITLLTSLRRGAGVRVSAIGAAGASYTGARREALACRR